MWTTIREEAVELAWLASMMGALSAAGVTVAVLLAAG